MTGLDTVMVTGPVGGAPEDAGDEGVAVEDPLPFGAGEGVLGVGAAEDRVLRPPGETVDGEAVVADGVVGTGVFDVAE